jgi:hypothetical protein
MNPFGTNAGLTRENNNNHHGNNILNQSIDSTTSSMISTKGNYHSPKNGN